jgi:hypothetical protein
MMRKAPDSAAGRTRGRTGRAVAFFACMVLKPTEVYVDTSLKNNPFSEQYVNNPADWVTDAELAKSKITGLRDVPGSACGAARNAGTRLFCAALFRGIVAPEP